MPRRSIPSLLRTIAVFIASVQAARAGATTVEAHGLGMSQHQNASAVGAMRLAAEPRLAQATVLTIATAVVVRRSVHAPALTHAVAPVTSRPGIQHARHGSTGVQRVAYAVASDALSSALAAQGGACVPSRPLLYGSHGPRSPCN